MDVLFDKGPDGRARVAGSRSVGKEADFGVGTKRAPDRLPARLKLSLERQYEVLLERL